MFNHDNSTNLILLACTAVYGHTPMSNKMTTVWFIQFFSKSNQKNFMLRIAMIKFYSHYFGLFSSFAFGVCYHAAIRNNVFSNKNRSVILVFVLPPSCIDLNAFVCSCRASLPYNLFFFFFFWSWTHTHTNYQFVIAID